MTRLIKAPDDDEDFAGLDWDANTLDELVKLFTRKYSHSSFLACVFYMAGYISMEKSSELGTLLHMTLAIMSKQQRPTISHPSQGI